MSQPNRFQFSRLTFHVFAVLASAEPLKLPEFNVACREARRAAFGQSVARLQQASSAAATTLVKVMLDTAAPPPTRVRAAECIMNHAIKAIEVEDIGARVSALEEATANEPIQ
jgi:hypothetical protein